MLDPISNPTVRRTFLGRVDRYLISEREVELVLSASVRVGDTVQVVRPLTDWVQGIRVLHRGREAVERAVSGERVRIVVVQPASRGDELYLLTTGTDGGTGDGGSDGIGKSPERKDPDPQNIDSGADDDGDDESNDSNINDDGNRDDDNPGDDGNRDEGNGDEGNGDDANDQEDDRGQGDGESERNGPADGAPKRPRPPRRGSSDGG